MGVNPWTITTEFPIWLSSPPPSPNKQQQVLPLQIGAFHAHEARLELFERDLAVPIIQHPPTWEPKSMPPLYPKYAATIFPKHRLIYLIRRACRAFTVQAHCKKTHTVEAQRRYILAFYYNG